MKTVYSNGIEKITKSENVLQSLSDEVKARIATERLNTSSRYVLLSVNRQTTLNRLGFGGLKADAKRFSLFAGCDTVCDGVVCDQVCDAVCDTVAGPGCDSVCDGIVCDAICDAITCDSNVCDAICSSVCDGICDQICDAIAEVA